MTLTRLLLIGLIAAGTATANDDLQPSNASRVGLRPAPPPTPVGLETRLAGPATDSPPAFGTVVQSWRLLMSGAWTGAGLTWRPDSNRFYLMDQGGYGGVWSCDVSDPLGTLRREERWVLPNLGTEVKDIPWGIAWDSDSGCFWISNIVDGDIYGGCHYVRMRKTAVGDTWRWLSENPGDTWLVGNVGGTGAGNMYWMGGSKKSSFRDYFVGMPVAPKGPNNHVWKFNPYTKTGLGRLQHGDSVCERGCDLIPWDSNYVLTAGWNSNYVCKRDSTGLKLQRAPAIEVSDVMLWVPQTIRLDDTVFMYTMLNDFYSTLEKRSVGMLWRQLPSLHVSNLVPTEVLSPGGTVDSGQTVVPRLVVQNTGRLPADDASAYFTVHADGVIFYRDSLTHLRLEPKTICTLAFAAWVPHGRDSLSLAAWTCWPGDSFPKDDTIYRRFLVRVQDVAVTEIPLPSPDTVLDSGAVIFPQCLVWNYGNVTSDAEVRFTIADYQSARRVSVAPRGAKLVAAAAPYTAKPGVWTCRASADVPGDQHPDNNTRVDTFTVTGAITRDVYVAAILAPTGVLDTGQAVKPKARFGNQGTEVGLFWTFFNVLDSTNAPVYCESFPAILRPADSVELEYPEVRFALAGSYTTTCSVCMAGDQDFRNDTKHGTFEVTAAGVTETLGLPQFTLSPIANPCRDFVLLSFTGPLDHMTAGPLSLFLYNASGRLVMRTPFAFRHSPFALDLRSLPVGVYVLRLSAGTFACTRKIVLQH